MNKFIELWEPVLRSFSWAYPNYYEEMVDWYPSAHLEITVKLRDGRKLTYELVGDYITFIKDGACDSEDIDEYLWRENFGMCLSGKMRKLGVSRDRLAEMTGISTVMLSKYMNGKAVPGGYNIYRMAKALNCSVAELTNMR